MAAAWSVTRDATGAALPPLMDRTELYVMREEAVQPVQLGTLTMQASVVGGFRATFQPQGEQEASVRSISWSIPDAALVLRVGQGTFVLPRGGNQRIYFILNFPDTPVRQVRAFTAALGERCVVHAIEAEAMTEEEWAALLAMLDRNASFKSPLARSITNIGVTVSSGIAAARPKLTRALSGGRDVALRNLSSQPVEVDEETRTLVHGAAAVGRATHGAVQGTLKTVLEPIRCGVKAGISGGKEVFSFFKGVVEDARNERATSSSGSSSSDQLFLANLWRPPGAWQQSPQQQQQRGSAVGRSQERRQQDGRAPQDQQQLDTGQGGRVHQRHQQPQQQTKRVGLGQEVFQALRGAAGDVIGAAVSSGRQVAVMGTAAAQDVISHRFGPDVAALSNSGLAAAVSVARMVGAIKTFGALGIANNIGQGLVGEALGLGPRRGERGVLVDLRVDQESGHVSLVVSPDTRAVEVSIAPRRALLPLELSARGRAPAIAVEQSVRVIIRVLPELQQEAPAPTPGTSDGSRPASRQERLDAGFRAMLRARSFPELRRSASQAGQATRPGTPADVHRPGTPGLG